MYCKWKMKILYIDYSDITKHVTLQDVMEQAENKFKKSLKQKNTHAHAHTHTSLHVFK